MPRWQKAAGTRCGSSSRERGSPCRWTASATSKRTTATSPGPALSACGPRPTASPRSTTSAMARRRADEHQESSMDLQLRPLTLDLSRLDGLSQRLVASHHENNYAGAVKRLNAIREQLSQLDWSATPVFVLNGLKREELIAANSAWLHELYFDVLGGDGVLPSCGLSIALERDFGTVDRWRAEFTALAKAMGGGSGRALLSWSSREGRLVNHWAADHTHLLAGPTPVLAHA